MAKFAKWIGGGLGWAMGGPIGGIMGFVIGSMVDGKGTASPVKRSRAGATGTTAGGYVMSLLVLVAAIMKADGKVMRSELDFVKQFLVRNFGEASASEAIQLLRDLLNQTIPVKDVCRQIERNMNYSARLQLLHFLYGIAESDSQIVREELDLIAFMAKEMGISQADSDSIKAMFFQDTGFAYTILEITPEASDDEIKKAYRRMAMKFHPDKLTHMGEEFQLAGQDKFKKVNEAYQAIKKERGLV